MSEQKHTPGKVKPIQWKANSHVSIWTGELIFGVYYTVYDEGSGYRTYRHQFLSEAGETEVAFSQAQDAAKEAAYADFSKAVLSVIESRS